MESVIDVKEIRNQKIMEFSNIISSLPKKLKLVVIQVGHDSSSDIYVKNKKKMCEDVGISFLHLKYDTISQDELISEIGKLNNDESVTGILVQLPLPDGFDSYKIINSISPLKDVDGLTKDSVGALFSGSDGLVPCTALGVMEILKSGNIDLKGANAVIVGRSKLVGMPLVSLLLRENATVTVCHSKTKNLKEITRKADVLIVAVGKAKLIDSSYVKDEAVVIDVGINRVNNKIYGDCDFESIVLKCKLITPVPGGVGLLTVTYLIHNLIKAYYLQNK